MVEGGPFNTVGAVFADLASEWSLVGPFEVGDFVTDSLRDAVAVACYRSQSTGKARIVASDPVRRDMVTAIDLWYSRGRWCYFASALWRDDLAA